MLKLKFLGELKIECDGKDLTGAVSSKAMALLAILTVQKGRQMTRRELINYLWPDSEPAAARYNLRYNLWQIKKLAAPDKDGNPFLIITKEQCRINDKFKAESDIGSILSADINQCDGLSQLESVYSLFTGDFFENCYFPGCEELEELIIMQRYSLEHIKLRLLKKLIRLYYESGEAEKCLKALRDCEELDPYDENNAEIRIRLLMEQGSYAESLSYYQRFYKKLARDIGVEPSEELKQLMGKDGSFGNRREEDGLQEVAVSVFAISAAEGYLMADIIRALLEHKAFSGDRERPFEAFLTERQQEDLAFIQPLLGNATGCVPMARVADAFIRLISGICGSGVSLSISVSGKMDALSAEVLQLLKKKLGDRLQVHG